MATGPAFGTNVGQDFTLQCNSDETGNQFKFVQYLSTGFIGICGANKLATGILQDAPVGTAGTPIGCQVRTAGVSKVKCGGSFSKGDLLASDASGQAVKYTGATVFTGTPYTVSGSQVLGIALEDGQNTAVVAMLFRPSGLCAAGNP
jgi:hypothetical protein